MPRIESVSDVEKLLGNKLKKGKRTRLFLEKTHLSANDKSEEEVVRGQEHQQEVLNNPKFYNNEQP